MDFEVLIMALGISTIVIGASYAYHNRKRKK